MPSPFGSSNRVMNMVFKGAKTTADKLRRLKIVENQPTVRNEIFRKAGMTGSAKIAPMVGLTVAGGAAAAGAAAIIKAKKGFDKDIDAQVKSSMAAEDIKVKPYRERNAKVQEAQVKLNEAKQLYKDRNDPRRTKYEWTPEAEPGYLNKAEKNYADTLKANPSIVDRYRKSKQGK